MMLDIDEDEPQHLSFRTAAGRTGAEYLSQVLCAAAYALEAGAQFEGVEGDAIIDEVAQFLNELLDDDDTEVGTAFEGWD
jgi:hypothetical protein